MSIIEKYKRNWSEQTRSMKVEKVILEEKKNKAGRLILILPSEQLPNKSYYCIIEKVHFQVIPGYTIYVDHRIRWLQLGINMTDQQQPELYFLFV
ncbi:2314_t:CDS:2 [Entrophospora sp. SA101]|nr:2314_t:CDS:2 [Entrophospora sp. SA101]